MWAIDQREMTDQSRVARGQDQSQSCAPAMPDERHLSQPQASHPTNDIFSHCYQIIAIFRLIAQPMSAQVKGDYEVPIIHMFRNHLPGIGSCSQPMNHY